MFLATTNRHRRLLQISYIHHVNVAELERGYEELKLLLAEFPAGYRLLVDFGRLESMDPAAMDIIGRTMELLEQHGLELVVRVIPDPSKDIGLKIIGIFHYHSKPRIVVCETMDEAGRVLNL
jgi:hypothetical protein